MDHNVAEKPLETLDSDFYSQVTPDQTKTQILRYKNETLFSELNHITSLSWTEIQNLSPLKNNLKFAYAQKYHGHQFHHYNPELGDGRGFTYTQFFYNNKWSDLGTKGSGPTPYSRRGDGKLTLKGAVRELLATNYLNYLGAKTSQTFSITETGEALDRHDEPSPTRSAVLTRFCHGHIRIGTFQRLAFEKKTDLIPHLIQYVLKFYASQNHRLMTPSIRPTLTTPDLEQFIEFALENSTQMAADLMAHHFCHGVLNTDNINITGELFDFGPYRFLPYYDPEFTAAYFDTSGLYAFARQPSQLNWCFLRLLEAIRPAFLDYNFNPWLSKFESLFHKKFENTLLKKLGFHSLNSQNSSKDESLQTALPVDLSSEFIVPFFTLAAKSPLSPEWIYWLIHQKLKNEQIHFSEQFHSGMSLEPTKDENELKKIITQPEFLILLQTQEKLQSHLDYQTPPNYNQAMLQTLRIDEIEKIWNSISEKDDWTLLNQKIKNFEV